MNSVCCVGSFGWGQHPR